jgi:hypothetical protein
MVAFVRNRPITTRTPTIEVDAGLEVGVHRFGLTVVTRDGRESKPVVVTVTIRRTIIRPDINRPVIDGLVRPIPIPVRPAILQPTQPVIDPLDGPDIPGRPGRQ